MRSDQLGLVQKAVKAIRGISVWVFILVLVMFAAALYLAVGERRKTLRNIGWAFVLMGLLVLVVRRFGGNYAVNALTTTQYRHPAHKVWEIYTSELRDLGWAVILYGVFGVLGAVLAGPTRMATRARGHIAPVLNENQGVAWAAVAVRLSAARPLGWDARSPHAARDPRPRCAARSRRRRAPPPDARRVPDRG